MRLNYVTLAVVLFACAATFTAVAQPESGVQGTITIGPTRAGPIKPDTPASMPLPQTAFVAKADDGAEISFVTDAEGRFRVTLPPGHYTVSRKGPKPAIGYFGPFTVEVMAGKMTKVEWQCDSGVR